MKILSRVLVLVFSVCMLSLCLVSNSVSDEKIQIERIELKEDTFTYTGEECRPEFTVYDAYDNIVTEDNYTYEYLSAVNASDVSTCVYVKAKAESDYKGSLKERFYINPVSMEDVTVSEIADCVYNGKAHKPLPEITYKGKSLVKGSDYTLTYENNVSVGTASVIIAGSNKNFEGNKEVSFDITPISIENYEIQVSDKTYTGSEITPKFKLVYNGQTLSYSKYTLSYENNINAGTATVTAMGIGNYGGSVSADFRILPKNVTPKIYLSESRFVYDATVKAPEVTSVTVGSSAISLDPSEYTVEYSGGRKNAGTYSVTVKLEGNYTGKSSKNFVIEQQSLKEAKVTLKKRTYTYSGKECKPEVTVTVDGVTLKKGTDYKVTYADNKKVGYGSVRVEGIGNYKSKSENMKFLIRKDIQKFVVTPKADSFKVSYSKLKSSAQSLTAAKTMKISDTVGKITYNIGYVAGRKYFSINQTNGTVTVAKGTPKGIYNLTLKLCAEGDEEHMVCYRLVDINIKVA